MSKRVLEYRETMIDSKIFEIHQECYRMLYRHGDVYRGKMDGNGIFKGKLVVRDKKFKNSKGQPISYFYDKPL